MARPLVRAGDANGAGGIVTPALCAKTVFAQFRPVALPGAGVTPHPCCGARGCGMHCVARVTTSGAGRVIVEGRPVVVVGDIDTCGHPRVTGSLTVIVGI